VEPDNSNDNIIRRRKLWFPCRITKARIQTHTRNIKYLLLFHDNNVYVKAPQCYVIRTLPVLFQCLKLELTSSLSVWMRHVDTGVQRNFAVTTFIICIPRKVLLWWLNEGK
jgi:hypothetical protein